MEHTNKDYSCRNGMYTVPHVISWEPLRFPPGPFERALVSGCKRTCGLLSGRGVEGLLLEVAHLLDLPLEAGHPPEGTEGTVRGAAVVEDWGN